MKQVVPNYSRGVLNKAKDQYKQIVTNVDKKMRHGYVFCNSSSRIIRLHKGGRMRVAHDEVDVNQGGVHVGTIEHLIRQIVRLQIFTIAQR